MRTIVLLGSVLALTITSGGAAPADDLLALLGRSKHTLEDGIKQVSRGGEAAISGKFEIHEGHLALSVYTVEKGLDNDPEHNVLKEYIGSPEGAEWKPEVEVFKDTPHISRSAMQETLVVLSPLSLTDVIKKAEKDQPGVVYSAIPKLKGRKAVYVVLVAKDGKSVELNYDVLTGEKK